MAIADLRMEIIVKIVCIAVLLGYVVSEVVESRNAGMGVNVNTEALAKERLVQRTCLLILGGSNARAGLSAAGLSTSDCSALNLAVADEMSDFDLYMTWLAEGARADVVIYSSLHALSSSRSARLEWFDLINHLVPIVSRLKGILLGVRIASEERFTKLGDQIHYPCRRGFVVQGFDPASFDLSTPKVVADLVKRVSVIQNITGTKTVIIQLPRLYLRNPNHEVLAVIRKRQAAIRRAGILLLDTPVVYSDKSLFCDQWHANERGRDWFTAEVIAALSRVRR